MTEAVLQTVDKVDPEILRRFLQRFFGDIKGEFLAHHGAWWHRGQENRMVLTVGREIAGYCAVIPTTCQLDDVPIPAVWWMDLVIAPEFRGRRLQSLLDIEVRRRGALLLGFPNKLAAHIHLKHGWGVREDLAVLAAPLQPRGLNAVRRSTGLKGAALRTAAALASPATHLWRRSLAWESTSGRALSRQEEFPSAHHLATIAALGRDAITTVRDQKYLRWRYLESPFRSQLRFITAGAPEKPRVAAVLRLLGPEMGGGGRLLDLFGDLDDQLLVAAAARRCLSVAAAAGAPQVTALAANPGLAACLRRVGFWLQAKTRFCWWSDDPEIMRRIGAGSHHWVLGDSDNDEPR